MNKLITTVLAAILTASCAGNIRPPQQPQPPPTQAFAVVVKDFIKPELPIQGASVRCSTEGEDVLRGTTNDDGYLAWPSAASYKVWACDIEKEGYQSNQANHYLTLDDATLYVPLSRSLVPGVQGRIRIEGNCYRDDTGCINLVYAHAGDLFSLYTRDAGRARSELDDVKRAGYHGIRTWAILGGNYWAGREVGPGVTTDYWVRLEEFFNELKSRNLRAVWSMGDIGQLRISRQDYMTQLASIDNRFEVIDWLDCGNEAWQTGEPDPAELSKCVTYYKNAGGRALLTLTSPPGEETQELNDYSIAPADAYDVHGYRGGHFWDKIRHIFSIPYEGRPNKAFGIQSEPWGSGDLVSVTENKGEINHEMSALGAVMSALGRQAWVWFSGEGVIIQGAGLKGEQGFYSNPQALALIPKDVTTYERLHHSGSSQSDVRTFAVPQDDVRIDGRTASDGRTVQVIYGPAGTYRVPVVRTFTGRICNPETAECTDLNVSAGSSFEVSFNRGRILIGVSQ